MWPQRQRLERWGPEPRNAGRPRKTGEVRKVPPWSLWREPALLTPGFGLLKPISEFWPPEQGENTFLLF